MIYSKLFVKLSDETSYIYLLQIEVYNDLTIKLLKLKFNILEKFLNNTHKELNIYPHLRLKSRCQPKVLFPVKNPTITISEHITTNFKRILLRISFDASCTKWQCKLYGLHFWLPICISFATVYVAPCISSKNAQEMILYKWQKIYHCVDALLSLCNVHSCQGLKVAV